MWSREWIRCNGSNQSISFRIRFQYKLFRERHNEPEPRNARKKRRIKGEKQSAHSMQSLDFIWVRVYFHRLYLLFLSLSLRRSWCLTLAHMTRTRSPKFDSQINYYLAVSNFHFTFSLHIHERTKIIFFFFLSLCAHFIRWVHLSILHLIVSLTSQPPLCHFKLKCYSVCLSFVLSSSINFSSIGSNRIGRTHVRTDKMQM